MFLALNANVILYENENQNNSILHLKFIVKEYSLPHMKNLHPNFVDGTSVRVFHLSNLESVVGKVPSLICNFVG